MTWLRRLRRLATRAVADERGAGYMAAFIVLFGTLTVGGVGLLVDSARIMAAERQTSSSAFEAARAGAQAVDAASTRAGSATLTVDQAQSRAAAAAGTLVSGSGGQVAGVEVTGDEVVVTISRSVDPWFPVVGAATVTETGTARLAVGITEEGQ